MDALSTPGNVSPSPRMSTAASPFQPVLLGLSEGLSYQDWVYPFIKRPCNTLTGRYGQMGLCSGFWCRYPDVLVTECVNGRVVIVLCLGRQLCATRSLILVFSGNLQRAKAGERTDEWACSRSSATVQMTTNSEGCSRAALCLCLLHIYHQRQTKRKSAFSVAGQQRTGLGCPCNPGF